MLVLVHDIVSSVIIAFKFKNPTFKYLIETDLTNKNTLLKANVT